MLTHEGGNQCLVNWMDSIFNWISHFRSNNATSILYLQLLTFVLQEELTVPQEEKQPKEADIHLK